MHDGRCNSQATRCYRVPWLKGVWYRRPFEHTGSVATLEDWFDPARLREDYGITGFKGFGVTTRRVPGHKLGINLKHDDKNALLAFLRTVLSLTRICSSRRDKV